MSGLVIAMPPERIALFKAIVESYDNLATLRTENPRAHHLKLYFSPEVREEVLSLVRSLAPRFSIRVLAED
jgi:hypothetical protein